jgi:hypothetical protein
MKSSYYFCKFSVSKIITKEKVKNYLIPCSEVNNTFFFIERRLQHVCASRWE